MSALRGGGLGCQRDAGGKRAPGPWRTELVVAKMLVWREERRSRAEKRSRMIERERVRWRGLRTCCANSPTVQEQSTVCWPAIFSCLHQTRLAMELQRRHWMIFESMVDA